MLKYVLPILFALLISGYYNYRTQPEIPVSRRWMLFALRFVSLLILLTLLLNPILYYTQRKTLAPKAILLEDSSASMELKHGSSAKAASLKPLADKLAGQFRDAGYELETYRFAAGLEGDKSGSLLAKTIEDLAKAKKLNRPAAMILLSDGWLRDESLAAISRLGSPFYVIADSSSTPIPDLEISSVISNRYAYRGEPNTIRADIVSHNYSGPVQARLLVGSKTISTQNLRLEEGKAQSLDFNHRFNSTGFFPWKVELSALTSESRLSNNSYPGAIEVLADKQRILLISDKPAWDNKFTLDAIATNPRWQTESYLNREGRLFSGETPVSRLSAENLAVIVIINNGNLKLDSATASFVNSSFGRGIGLLYQGLPVAELASSLPLQRSNIQSSYQGFLSPTPQGSAYPMLSPLTSSAKDLPPLDYYYVSALPGSEILATINNPQNSPAIAEKTMGGSRCLAFATLNLWRWQLQSGEEGYNKLISSSLTWLSNKSSGAYSAIYNNSYFLGEEIRIRLRNEDEVRQSKLDANPRIRILGKNNKEVAADYMTRDGDEFSFTASLKEPGTYSFEISDKESGQSTKGRFELSDSSLEKRDFGYNLPLLSWLANETNGKLLFQSNLNAFSPLPAQAEELVSRKEIALYKKWYFLSLFILAFCLELYFRRRWGLL